MTTIRRLASIAAALGVATAAMAGAAAPASAGASLNGASLNGASTQRGVAQWRLTQWRLTQRGLAQRHLDQRGFAQLDSELVRHRRERSAAMTTIMAQGMPARKSLGPHLGARPKVYLASMAGVLGVGGALLIALADPTGSTPWRHLITPALLLLTLFIAAESSQIHLEFRRRHLFGVTERTSVGDRAFRAAAVVAVGRPSARRGRGHSCSPDSPAQGRLQSWPVCCGGRRRGTAVPRTLTR